MGVPITCRSIHSSTDEAIVSRPGMLTFVNLDAAGGNAQATLYDNTSATGNPILVVDASNGDSSFKNFSACPIAFSKGIFVSFTGTSPTLQIGVI